MRKSNIYAFALIASGLCSFFYPSRAVADPIDVVNINFSGQVACLTSLTPACGTSTGTVT